MAKYELMTSPDVPKDQKECAPFIRSFDSFKNEEIRSNFGGPAAQDDKGEDDLGKSPSPMNSSNSSSMSDFFGSLSPASDNSDKDMQQLSIPKIKKRPDCSEIFISYAVSPMKARSLLKNSGIKQTKKRKFENLFIDDDASEVASGPPVKKAKLCENIKKLKNN